MPEHWGNRLMGVETEYGIDTSTEAAPSEKLGALTVDSALTDRLSDDNSQPLPERVSMLSNSFPFRGSRFYLDVGAHPEYSTCEATTPRDVTKEVLIGHEFTVGAFQKAVKRLEAHNKKVDAVLQLKNCDQLDSERSSWGCHGNYQVSREAFPDMSNYELHASLATHFISRIIYTGSGGYLGSDYYISPRSQFHEDLVSPETLKTRPLINTRDEPHTINATKWRRIHDISSDANVSPWARHMNVGTTMLVLKAIEAGESFYTVCPVEPVNAFHEFGRDIKLRHRVRCNDNQYRTALDIQRVIFDCIKRYSELPWEQEVIEEMDHALYALHWYQCQQKLDDNSRFLHNIDWYNLAWIIREKAEPDYPAAMIDYRYSQLYRSGTGAEGIGRKQLFNGRFRLTPDGWDSPQAPLPSERARVRAACVDKLGKTASKISLDWSHIVLPFGDTEKNLRLPEDTEPAPCMRAQLERWLTDNDQVNTGTD